MQRHVAWLSIVGFLASLAGTAAQIPPTSAPVTKYDGTYAVTSVTKLNETFLAGGTRPTPCGDLKGGLLTIVSGHARYTVGGRGYYKGTVTSQGELTMQFAAPMKFGMVDERIIYGRIDGDGAVRVRRITRACNYDLMLEKQSK